MEYKHALYMIETYRMVIQRQEEIILCLFMIFVTLKCTTAHDNHGENENYNDQLAGSIYGGY